MDMSDGRGSHPPTGHGGGHDEDWNAGTDPADEWILDPVTGEYRMRSPEERRTESARRREIEPWQPAAGPGSRRAADPAPRRAAVETTARLELLPAPRSRAASRTAPSRAASSRTNDRRANRGRRRNSGAAGGFWLAGTLGIVGLLGCGTGGYLLFHDGNSKATACAAAKSAPTPSTAASQAADGGSTPQLGPGPKAQPIDVRVTVLNGSGVLGQAEAALSWMQNTEGFLRTSNGGPAKITATTSLVYAPDHADQARTLAAAMDLPASALHGTGTGTGLRDPMTLVLGRDFTTAGQPLAQPVAPTPTSSTSAGCGA